MVQKCDWYSIIFSVSWKISVPGIPSPKFPQFTPAPCPVFPYIPLPGLTMANFILGSSNSGLGILKNFLRQQPCRWLQPQQPWLMLLRETHILPKEKRVDTTVSWEIESRTSEDLLLFIFPPQIPESLGYQLRKAWLPIMASLEMGNRHPWHWQHPSHV